MTDPLSLVGGQDRGHKVCVTRIISTEIINSVGYLEGISIDHKWK